jgi:hypothetical protein
VVVNFGLRKTSRRRPQAQLCPPQEFFFEMLVVMQFRFATYDWLFRSGRHANRTEPAALPSAKWDVNFATNSESRGS